MSGNPISGPILELKNAHKAFGSKQVCEAWTSRSRAGSRW